ncbi:hypothetical protein ACJX0J_015860, partial [Zea mays]
LITRKTKRPQIGRIFIKENKTNIFVRNRVYFLILYINTNIVETLAAEYVSTLEHEIVLDVTIALNKAMPLLNEVCIKINAPCEKEPLRSSKLLSIFVDVNEADKREGSIFFIIKHPTFISLLKMHNYQKKKYVYIVLFS